MGSDPLSLEPTGMQSALRELVEASSEGVWRVDALGRTLYANPRMADMLGVNRETLASARLYDFVFNEDLEIIEASRIRHTRGQAENHDLRLRRATGETLWVQMSTTPLFDDRERFDGAIALVSDITERKSIEAHLEFLSELNTVFAPSLRPDEVVALVGERLARHLGLSRLAFSEVDLETDTITAVFEWRDDALPSVLGQYRLSELLTTEGRQHYASGAMAVINDARENTLLRVPPEIPVRNRSNAIIDSPYLEHGRWRFLLTVAREKAGQWRESEIELVREVTARAYIRLERARAEETLAESEEKYRTLFDSIDEGFAIVEVFLDERGSVTDLAYREANEAFERYSGMRDFIGKRVSEILPNLEQHWLDMLTHIYQTGESARMENYIAELSRWLNVHYSRVGGDGSRFIAVVFDNITERKRREAHQTLLVEIGDDLSRLVTPEEIMQAVGARLGASLGLSNCLFADVDEAGGTITVHDGWNRAGAPSLKQTFTIADYLTPANRAGERTIVRDTAADERTDTDFYAHLGLGAFVTIPFYRSGRWVANFGVGDSRPRDWRADEIELLENISERVFPRIERARAEAALRASEEKYRTLFDSIDEGVTTVEILFDENGRAVDFIYLEHNPALTRMTGLTSDIAGRRVSDIAPDLEAYWFENYGHVVRTGEPARFEHSSKDLGDLWFDVFASRVGGEGSRQVVVVYSNITERKRTEANLAFLADLGQDLVGLTEIDETMAALGTKIGQFFGVKQCMFSEHIDQFKTVVASYGWHAQDALDLRGTYPMQDFLSNEMMAALMTGKPLVVNQTQSDPRVSAERYGALNMASFIAVPLIQENEWRFQIFIADDKPRNWRADEIELLRELAHRIWAQLERARAEVALHTSEAHLRLVLESALEYAIFTTDLGGNVSTWNAGATRIFGYTEAQMLGQSARRLYLPEDRARGQWEQEMRIAEERGRAMNERWHLRADGSSFYGSGAVMPLRANGERLLGFLKIMRDLTLQKEAETALHRSLNLQQRFAADASHELRGPLASVLGNLELVQLYPHMSDSDRNQALRDAHAEATRMARLVNDLLSMTRGDTGLRLRLESIDLGWLTRDVLRGLETYTRDHRVETALAPVTVIGDADRLRELLQNLLENAVKYTPQGGSIRVEVRARDNLGELRVTDSGIGISRDDLPHVFERFFRADPSRTPSSDPGGTGLGLSLVKQIVEAHGGEVWLESELGVGTTAVVCLPQAAL